VSREKAIVVTTIQLPTAGVRRLTELRPDWFFVVVGDRATPVDWHWPGVEYLSMEAQQGLGEFARALPPNHYARKNLGYLQAMRRGAEVIYETDDDNLPYDHLLATVERQVSGPSCEQQGWVNVYRHFTDMRVWPRGFPLELLNAAFQVKLATRPRAKVVCPIQQFLADGDPDVDAIFRLTQSQVIRFRPGTLILGPGSYSPFNSQNTIWWEEAFPLLYLPGHVPFRMTDIWRSYVAQTCLYRAGHYLAFREATVFQDRNAHDLLRDFRDEVPGYLNNQRIMKILEALDLSRAPQDMVENLRLCYRALVRSGIMVEAELPLVDAWLREVQAVRVDPVAS
jgi:STELLO glycosyltransferases